MPRRKSNARSCPKRKKIREQVVLLPVDPKNAETMSPGKLVAVAEYKIVEGY